MEMHVDTHVHVISEDEKQYPLNPSHATGPWYREDPCSVERLMRLMDDAAVDAAVLVQAISAYQHDNRYCAESARRFPERFTSVACTDLAAADAVDEARRVVNDDHMRGIRWVAIRDGGVGEPRAVWDAIDHCAFADFSHGVPEALAALAAFPRVHLKVSSNALDLMAAHGEPAEMVEELAARFGADHLMWGSDYSQTHDRPYVELVEWGRKATAKLSDDDRAWFLGGTAVSMWPELAR